MPMIQPIAAFPFFIGFALFLFIGTLWFHSYTGLKRDKAYLALVASTIGGGFRSYHRGKFLHNFYNSENELENWLTVTAVGVVIVFLTAFALRLWGRWIGGLATEAERRPGVEGIRAWFCTSNIFIGSALVVCAWLGDDISPLLGVVIVVALLVAQPVIRMESPAPVAVPPSAPEDLSPEREKIVSMLEAGKLTPDESAELLQALGGSKRAPATPVVPLTSGQRLMLIGAALVLLGFFLPWFVFNPGKELGHMFGQVQSTVTDSFAAIPQPPGYPAGGGIPQPAAYMPTITTANISISGGDIQHGLGWAALLFALASALLPYVATALDLATARTIRLLSLGMGGLIMLYLLTQNLRLVGIGLLIAASGYALEIVGAVRERRAGAVE